MFPMNIYTAVADCCGLHAIEGLPITEKEFKEKLLDVRADFPYEREVDEDGDFGQYMYNYGMYGAFVMCTTSNRQVEQEIYLKKFGFNPVGTEVNSNSGNKVTVWLMSCRDFDALLDSWS